MNLGRALAISLAQRFSNRFPNAQLWFTAREDAATGVAFMRHVIQSFAPRIQLPDDHDALSAQYRSTLVRAGPTLLVLDNAKRAEDVAQVIPPTTCLLLVTSRHELHLPGFASHPVNSLSTQAAVSLLRQLAPRLPDHAPEAAAIVGNLPLGLQVVAGLVNENPLFEVADLLQRIRVGTRRLGEIDAVFATSCEVLDDALCLRWQQLAVFPGDFGLVAATAIWGDDLSGPEIPDVAKEAMQALMKAHLVESEQKSTRYRLHDLARNFAASNLGPTKLAALRLQHAKVFQQLSGFMQYGYEQGGAETLRALAAFYREKHNFEFAIRTLTEAPTTENAPILVSLVGHLVQPARLRIPAATRIAWHERALEAARLGCDGSAEMSCLADLGFAHLDAHHVDQAIRCFHDSLQIAESIGDDTGRRRALGDLGAVYLAKQEHEAALPFLERAMALAQASGDRRSQAITLGNLGAAYAELDRLDEALAASRERLRIAGDMKDLTGEVSARGNIGTVYRRMGKPEAAIEEYKLQIELAEKLGDKRIHGLALFNSGLAFSEMRLFDLATSCLEESIVILDSIDDPVAKRVREQLQRWKDIGVIW